MTQAISPPHLKNGGCVLQDYLVTPDGERLSILTFHGDLEGWQRQIEEGAALLNWTSAKISEDQVLLSDGRTFPVAICKLESD